MYPILIHPLNPHPTIVFAAQELQRYLAQMGNAAEIVFQRENAIALGLFSDFPASFSPIAASPLDDHLHAAVAHGQGIIAGANPRSVLMAVYRFLKRAGCRFIRPGRDGEFIPQVDVSTLDIHFDEAPAYRHRGLCIEGAVSLEHMLASVDWCPKVGLNAYFLEFMLPYIFFDRWYRHELNPHLTPEPVSVEDVAGFMRTIEAEIVRRGLVYHNPGHGWTCEPLGIPGLGWYRNEYHLPPETTSLLAEVNGKREIWTGIPLNTHLCYSNPLARQKVVDYAVAYMQQKPHIDLLHVWLADAMNNVCECPACCEVLPADHYVQLLNELDAAFSAHGIPAKIVFIAYLDLLWPPQTHKFANPGRFLLLFAPISRSYSQPYDTDTTGLPLPAYARNKITLPSGIRQNLVYLREWQKFFSGDALTYEYHFMWDCYLDPAYYAAAKVLHQDVQKLRQMGLNGIMSDQSQRAYFPTALGMHVLARTLWDDKVDFETLAAEYFTADFGAAAGPQVRAYLETLSALFDPPYLRGDYDPRDESSHTWVLGGAAAHPNPAAAHRLSQIPGVIAAFRPVIEQHLAHPDPCRARSWQLLAHHAEIATGLAHAFQCRAEGNPAAARQHWEQVQEYVQRHETELQYALDVFEFITVLGARFPLIPSPSPTGGRESIPRPLEDGQG